MLPVIFALRAVVLSSSERIKVDKAKLLAVAKTADASLLSKDRRGWYLLITCWMLSGWVLIAYGVLIYDNMAPAAWVVP